MEHSVKVKTEYELPQKFVLSFSFDGLKGFSHPDSIAPAFSHLAHAQGHSFRFCLFPHAIAPVSQKSCVGGLFTFGPNPSVREYICKYTIISNLPNVGINSQKGITRETPPPDITVEDAKHCQSYFDKAAFSRFCELSKTVEMTVEFELYQKFVSPKPQNIAELRLSDGLKKCTLNEDVRCKLFDEASADVWIVVLSTDVVDAVRFPAHSFVLAARSSVFAAMLESKMAEMSSREVQVDDVDPHVMREVIK